MQTVITTVASVPFAMAICALIKRQWPQVTGWITPVVILACTSAAGALGQYADSIPPVVWIIAGPIVAAVSALGLHQAGKDAVATAQTTPDTPPAKLPLDRDTTPTIPEK